MDTQNRVQNSKTLQKRTIRGVKNLVLVGIFVMVCSYLLYLSQVEKASFQQKHAALVDKKITEIRVSREAEISPQPAVTLEGWVDSELFACEGSVCLRMIQGGSHGAKILKFRNDIDQELYQRITGKAITAYCMLQGEYCEVWSQKMLIYDDGPLDETAGII